MTVEMEDVKDNLHFPYVWIYNWSQERFYCLPSLGPEDERARDPIAVTLSPNFSAKYNHLVLITRNVESLRHKLSLLKKETFGITRVCVLSDQVGHLIMQQRTPEEIMRGEHVGVPVLIFCRQARWLSAILENNYYFFHIEAMGKFQSSIQCFFNVRRMENGHFKSRGLFRLLEKKKGGTFDDRGIEERLQYVSEGEADYFVPPYKCTSLAVRAIRLDGGFPQGDTSYDRLCAVTFETVTVYPSSLPPPLARGRTTRVFTLCPDERRRIPQDNGQEEEEEEVLISTFSSERELLANVMEYLRLPTSIYVMGWNCRQFDFPFLFNRLVYYEALSAYVRDDRWRRVLRGIEAADPCPPWKLSIDILDFRKRYFPKHLAVNPPSNRIEDVAKSVLPDYVEEKTRRVGHAQNVAATLALIEKKDKEEESVAEEVVIGYARSLIAHGRRRAKLVMRLQAALNVIQVLLPLSQMADVNPGDCVHYNSTRVAVTYMRNYYQSSVFAPLDVNVLQGEGNRGRLKEEAAEKYYYSRGKKDGSGRDTTTFRGGLVLEPEVGIHRTTPGLGGGDDILGCLDFASLYPSIMITYNAARGYVTSVSRETYRKNQRVYDQHFEVLLLLLEGNDNDDDTVYLTAKEGRAPISSLCLDLIRRRKEYKEKAPTMANALKTMVNALFGIHGLRSSVVYDQVVAAVITAYGRYHLTRLRKYLEGHYNQRLRVLYGDTDSVFIHFRAMRGETLELVASDYNAHLRRECAHTAIELAVEGRFECLILVRKKLYLAKKYNIGYKFSGFPQRLNPETQGLMTRALQNIVEIAARVKDPRLVLDSIYADIFQPLFRDVTRKNDETGGGGGGIPVKVQPLTWYASTSSKNYYVAKLYEEKTGRKIGWETYVPVHELIPLVQKPPPGKRYSLCLTSDLNPGLHTVNQSATITEFFSKTFDPILTAVSEKKKPWDNKPNLKEMSATYVAEQRCLSLLKYREAGYCVVDWSKVETFPRRNNDYFDFEEVWPHFHREGLDKWVNGMIKRPNVALRINLHTGSDENGYYHGGSYATLADYQGERRRFHSLKELSLMLTREMGIITPAERSLIRISVVQHRQPNAALAALDILGFLYDDAKPLSISQRQSLSGRDDTKLLILLPFVGVQIIQKKDDYRLTLRYY